MSLFDITTKKKELQELENKTLEPNFWDDNKESGKVLSKIRSNWRECIWVFKRRNGCT